MRQDRLKKSEQIIYIVTNVLVWISILYSIIPMIVFRGDYIFTIHDGLDGFGGVTQYIHEKGLGLLFNKGIDFSHSDLSSYYYVLSYDCYTFLCCIFGVVNGHILNRILGVVIGYFSMKMLLHRVFQNVTSFQKYIIMLSSVLYVVTPVAPNRMLAFATLPLVVLLFLYLREKYKFSRISFVALLIPFFSIFAAAVVFIIGFWLLFTVIQFIKDKRLNSNLNLCFLFMIISTILINRSYFIMAFGDNNRSLLWKIYNNGFLKPFVAYLLNGQYHSTALQGFLVLEMLILMTIWMLFYIRGSRSILSDECKKSIAIIVCGWILWVGSAFLLAIREAGMQTGLLFIDGFEWGRLVGFMRPMWFIMIIAFVVIKPRTKLFKNSYIGALIGIILAVFIWYGVRLIRGNVYVPTLVRYDLFELVAQIVFLAFAVLLFTSSDYEQIAIYVLLCIQLGYVMMSAATYNDTGISLFAKVTNDSSENSVTLNEFYSPKLFDEIKKDISYSDEFVVAYGYHPSVLQYNGFKTLDRYESVHSMRIQEQFREIIEPALEKYPDKKEYYDGWGGRMYLYGELGYEITRNKDIYEVPLYINTKALKKYGGRYILSRAVISNAEELGIQYINDYDMVDSLYHIYLYEAE